jgi:hypothetical protein
MERSTRGDRSRRDWTELLDCAADLREDIASVRANQPDRAYNDDDDDGQHDGILGDVLPFFI